MNKWIDVYKKLPDRSCGVLIFDHGCENAFYNKTNGFFETDSTPYATPTHWMPLPSPPEVK